MTVGSRTTTIPSRARSTRSDTHRRFWTWPGRTPTGITGTTRSRAVAATKRRIPSRRWPTSRTATTSAGVQGAEQDLNVFRVQARGLLPGVTLVNQGTIQTFQQRSLTRDQAIYGQEEVLALDERLFVSAGFRADRSSANGDRNKLFLFPKGAASYRLLA